MMYVATLATATAVALLATAYFWVFQAAGCSGHSDFGCLLNVNQGVLTLVALLTAAVAVWASLLTTEANRRQARRVALTRARETLVATLDEIRHNLEHVALACREDGSLSGIPQLSVRSMEYLLGPEIRPYFLSDLLRRADMALRNYERFQRAASRSSVAAIAPQQYHSVLWEGSLGPFVAQSVHFLIVAGAGYRAWSEAELRRPGLQDILRLSDRLAADREYYYENRSSEVDDRALAELRAHDAPLVCWVRDRDLDGVDVIELYRRFSDLTKLHSS